MGWDAISPSNTATSQESPEEEALTGRKLTHFYSLQMFPFFILLSVLENVARFFAGKSISRMNDTVASISQGIFQDCLR